MQISVAKDTLMAGLQAVHGIVGSRTALPILSNVLMQAENGKLMLTTTDLEVSMRCSVTADVNKEGATSLPLRQLIAIIRELPAGNVEIEVDDKHTASITSGSAFFRIVGMSDEEFPPLPKLEGGTSYSLDQKIFKEMLQKTSYAASADETRYILNGTLLSFKGDKLTVVATDGRRLALAEQEIEFPKEAEGDIVVPSKTVTELLKSLQDEGTVRIHALKTQIGFELDSVLIVSKLIEGNYPNFRQVIPAQCEQRVALDREMLLSVVRRVAVLTSDKSSSIRLNFNKNKLKISASSPDVGEAHETLPVKFTAKELTVAFNPQFLMDPLRNLTNDEVYLELTDELSPGVVKCDVPFLYVIMPMRVN